MKSTTILCITLILILIPLHASAATPNRYNVDLQLSPETRVLHATVVLTFHAPQTGGSIRFLLNKSLKVTSVACSICKRFRFATDEPPGYRYIPDGAPLHVPFSRPVRAGEELQITFVYEGQLADLAWGVNQLTPDYVELAQYIGWYPFLPEMRSFQYTANVGIPAAYDVTGEGEVSRVGPGKFRIVETTDTFDIVLVAARGLKSKKTANASTQLVYVPSIADASAAEIVGQTESTLAYYTKWFGPQRGGHLTVLLNTRANGGSYVRPGFISLALVAAPEEKKRRAVTASLAHELGHLWWTGAPVTTWEDWLNESFAQYSSWLVLKQVYGAGEFEKLIADARERTSKTPAVWGVDRSADVAYLVLYDKGALRLHDLAADVGEQKFSALMREVAQMSPKTTTEFLARTERATSSETRAKFEASLKN